MKIKIITEVPVAGRFKPERGSVHEVLKVDKGVSTGYWITVKGEQVKIWDYECEVLQSPKPEEKSHGGICRVCGAELKLCPKMGYHDVKKFYEDPKPKSGYHDTSEYYPNNEPEEEQK